MSKRGIGLAGIILFWAFHHGAVIAEEHSLQGLVDKTPTNGVLMLENKTYLGNVVINKPITIKGSVNTIIKGDGTGNVIIIKEPGHGVELNHLTITHSSKNRNSEEEYSAIKVLSNHNVLKNLTIMDSYHGIYLSYSDDNQISNVNVMGVGGNEIAGQGNGIQLIHSHRNKLLNTTIRETRDGIYFYYSNENLVKENVISHTRYGLHYMYSDDNHFLNNQFRLNTGGAAIMHSKRIELKGNEFSYHQGTRSFGLMLQSSDDNQIIGNHFFHNQRGLYIDQSQSNRMTSNEFHQNQVGVELWASSSQQVFSLNRFFHNTIPVITLGGQGNNQWSENRKGNDWGEGIPLFDLKQDGIGDIPVEYQSSFAKLLEDQELVYLFLHSPSIYLYEKMNQFLYRQEKVFEDPYPLMNSSAGDLPMAWFTIPLMLIFVICYVQRRRKRP